LSLGGAQTQPIAATASDTDVQAAVNDLLDQLQLTGSVTVVKAAITQTITVPAGPYFRVQAIGAVLTVAGQTLSGDVAIEQSINPNNQKVVRVQIANASLSLGGGVVTITNGFGNLVITPDGMAGTVGGTVGVNLTGLSLGGTVEVAFNTSAA